MTSKRAVRRKKSKRNDCHVAEKIWVEVGGLKGLPSPLAILFLCKLRSALACVLIAGVIIGCVKAVCISEYTQVSWVVRRNACGLPGYRCRLAGGRFLLGVTDITIPRSAETIVLVSIKDSGAD